MLTVGTIGQANGNSQRPAFLRAVRMGAMLSGWLNHSARSGTERRRSRENRHESHYVRQRTVRRSHDAIKANTLLPHVERQSNLGGAGIRPELSPGREQRTGACGAERMPLA